MSRTVRFVPFSLALLAAAATPWASQAQSNAPLTGGAMSGVAQASPVPPAAPAAAPAAQMPARPVVQQVQTPMPQAAPQPAPQTQGRLDAQAASERLAVLGGVAGDAVA
ncbi:DUF3613 domain-containing protein, partial [Achromobacter dolens]|uniref:DUF3613 domain-containing protein n=1 Tax=Achromobacter dolens TaxID=1287738 RepID=UPI0022B88041